MAKVSAKKLFFLKSVRIFPVWDTSVCRVICAASRKKTGAKNRFEAPSLHRPQTAKNKSNRQPERVRIRPKFAASKKGLRQAPEQRGAPVSCRPSAPAIFPESCPIRTTATSLQTAGRGDRPFKIVRQALSSTLSWANVIFLTKQTASHSPSQHQLLLRVFARDETLIN